MPFAKRFISGLLLLAVLVSGCARLQPGSNFLMRDKYSDQRRFVRFDPFPSEDLGPETFTRPRDFQTERAEPRKIDQGRKLLGVPPELAPGTPDLPLSRHEYRDTVRE